MLSFVTTTEVIGETTGDKDKGITISMLTNLISDVVARRKK